MPPQNLSRHQQSIVKRYYENLDALALQKLGEIVSELALCESQKKADRLWERASKSLTNAGMKKDDAAAIVARRDVEELARMVSDLSR